MDIDKRKLFERKSFIKDSHCFWTLQRASINRHMEATMKRKISGSVCSLWICRFVKSAPRTKRYCWRHRRNTRVRKKIGKLEITKEKIKIPEQTKDTPTSFAATSLGTFKSFGIRRVALSARLGI